MVSFGPSQIFRAQKLESDVLEHKNVDGVQLLDDLEGELAALPGEGEEEQDRVDVVFEQVEPV